MKSRCVSAKISAEQSARVPTLSLLATETVCTCWVSTGWKTLPVWSVDASSWTEPYSSCACQSEQRRRRASRVRQKFKALGRIMFIMFMVIKFSNNLPMIHISKTNSYNMTLMHVHQFDKISRFLLQLWNSIEDLDKTFVVWNIVNECVLFHITSYN